MEIKIKIKLGDEELSLSPKEANELFDALEGIFGERVEKLTPIPEPHWGQPNYIHHYENKDGVWISEDFGIKNDTVC